MGPQKNALVAYPSGSATSLTKKKKKEVVDLTS
jgi:hypothetical protein